MGSWKVLDFLLAKDMAPTVMEVREDQDQGKSGHFTFQSQGKLRESGNSENLKVPGYKS